MMSRMSRVLALPVLLAATLSASSAHAFIDAEALVGKRFYHLATPKALDVTSTEVAVAAHIDPIPLVPVSFGARVGVGTLDNGPLKTYFGAASIDNASIVEAGLDVTAWIPMVPVITPYARLNIPVYGAWAVKGKILGLSQLAVPFEENGKISGMQLSIGAKYPILPLIKVLVEANLGNETWKESTYTVDGSGISSNTSSHALTSKAVFLGVEAGF